MLIILINMSQGHVRSNFGVYFLFVYLLAYALTPVLVFGVHKSKRPPHTSEH